MKIVLIIGSIIVPLVMTLLQNKWFKARILFNGLAIVAALIFGNISSIAIYNILIDDTVFMTNIHGIFLNPFFLITGAYLGVYLVYTLILSVIREIG